MGKSGIKKRFRESAFFKVIKVIRNNLGVYFYTLVFDFIFLGLIFFIGKYVGSFIPSDAQQLMDYFKSKANLLLFVTIYPVIYYLFVIFVYSITKLSVLNLVKAMHEKNKISLKGIGKFYVLNIIIFIIFFFSGVILMATLAFIFKKEFMSYATLVLAIPFLLLLYSVINISHTMFVKGFREKVARRSFKITVYKIKSYGMFLAWDIVLILVYLVVYNMINLLFKFFILTSSEMINSYGGVYVKTANIISLIFVYLIIAFNRVYFYERIDKSVL